MLALLEPGYGLGATLMAWATVLMFLLLIVSVLRHFVGWLKKVNNKLTTPSSVDVTIEQMYAERVDINAPKEKDNGHPPIAG